MSQVRQGRQILDVAGGEEHVAGGDHQRLFVHGICELLRVDAHAVVALQNDQFQVGPHLPLIQQGGEIQLGRDDPAPSSVLQALGDHREGSGGGGKERDGAGVRSKEAGDLPSKLLQRSEPMLVPGRRAHVVPPGRELRQASFGLGGQGAE